MLRSRNGCPGRSLSTRWRSSQLPRQDNDASVGVHLIPASQVKLEPPHWHFDLRYAFSLTGDPTLELQADEVSGFDWLPVGAGADAEIREKLSARTGT